MFLYKHFIIIPFKRSAFNKAARKREREKVKKVHGHVTGGFNCGLELPCRVFVNGQSIEWWNIINRALSPFHYRKDRRERERERAKEQRRQYWTNKTEVYFLKDKHWATDSLKQSPSCLRGKQRSAQRKQMNKPKIKKKYKTNLVIEVQACIEGSSLLWNNENVTQQQQQNCHSFTIELFIYSNLTFKTQKLKKKIKRKP